jgi:predicted glycosyltransferase
VLRVLAAGRLDAASLAQAIEEALAFEPAPLALDLDGASRTAHLLKALVRDAQPAVDRRATAYERLA